MPHATYHYPSGLNLAQTLVNSIGLLHDPVNSLVKDMDRFSGTYSAWMGVRKKAILTQDAGLINHLLKDNHRNYEKSAIGANTSRFMGNGILFSKGDFWLRQRRMIQPAFHRERLQALQQVVIGSIEKSLAGFPEGEQIDICPPVQRLSFDILIRSIFNLPLPPTTMTEINGIFTGIQEFLLKDINQPWRRLLYQLSGAERNAFQRAMRLREIIRDIIRERKATASRHDDLLDMLLDAVYEDTGEKMPEEQVIDEVIILIFAGQETTGNTLSWLLYLLASHQPVLANMLDAISGKTIGESTGNEYLKATIYEGMRLFPAAWMTERAATEDDAFGEFSWPAGTTFILFFFGLHRDEHHWEDPLKFKPQRFIDNVKAARSAHFMPFGAGPRMCVGNNFAMLEMSIFLHAFLNNFHIQPTLHVPAMKARMTLKPDKVILDIRRYAERRSGADVRKAI
jgi:cytochrome P450